MARYRFIKNACGYTAITQRKLQVEPRWARPLTYCRVILVLNVRLRRLYKLGSFSVILQGRQLFYFLFALHRSVIFEKESTVKGKNMLSWGANSVFIFFYSRPLFRRDVKQFRKSYLPWKYIHSSLAKRSLYWMWGSSINRYQHTCSMDPDTCTFKLSLQ